MHKSLYIFVLVKQLSVVGTYSAVISHSLLHSFSSLRKEDYKMTTKKKPQTKKITGGKMDPDAQL